jgi:hypothetical protein
MQRGSAELMRLCKLFAVLESLTKPGLDYIALDVRMNSENIPVISGFRRDIDEIYGLFFFTDFLTLEDGIDTSQNVSKGLPFDAA